MLGSSLLITAALAQPASLEVARWEVRYLGVAVGQVEATTERHGETWVTTGAARSAPWYRPIYDLDDTVTSTWVPTQGSLRYQARFREGRFHQDQDQRFGPDGVVVELGQRKKGAWVTWTDRLAPSPGAFDPIAAMQTLRSLDGAGPWVVPVFSGRTTRPLRVTLVDTERLDHDLLGPVSVRVLDLQTDHRGELQQAGRFRVWVTDDPRRLLARAVVQTNVGAVRVELIASEPPAAGPAPEAAIAGP
jgi:hypothetical protein